MKIYVTGSSGLAGRNLVETIKLTGHEVVTTRSSEVNLLDYDATEGFISECKPEMIVHAAGKVGGIQANIKDPCGFFIENMLMGINLVKAAIKLQIPKTINLSSSCSYPCNLERQLTELDVFAGKLEPTNEGYAIAKASMTRLCEFASQQHSASRFKTLIPCNLYGKYDKFGEENSHMIPGVIRKIHLAKINGDDSVTIWGDGSARREFLYATDFAEMVADCIEKFDEIPTTMNIGLGCDYSINDYYKAIAEVVGFTGHFEYDKTKPVGMKRKLLDISKQKQFGILAKRSLTEGIRETYEYFLQTNWSRP
jgi:GDP-L-fucose synthase